MNVVKGFDFVDASKVDFAMGALIPQITPVTHFASDLGLDTVEISKVVKAVKAEFCLEDSGCKCYPMSVDEMTACISRNPRAK